MTYDDLYTLVKDRCSVRHFRPDPVPAEAVAAILRLAALAPSSGNTQPWEFIVITDAAVRSQIADLYTEQAEDKRRMEETRPKELRHPVRAPSWRQAPVLILALCDPRLKRGMFLRTMLDKGDQHQWSSMATITAYIKLAAHTLGLGSHWVSDAGSPHMSVRLKHMLGVPDPLTVYDLIPIGYPDETRIQRTGRRDPESFVHYERYDMDKHRSDTDIMDFITGKPEFTFAKGTANSGK